MTRFIGRARATATGSRLLAALVLVVGLGASPALGAAAPGARGVVETPAPPNVAGSWAVQATPPSGSAIYDAVTGTDGKIYVAGNFNPHCVCEPQLASYSPTTNSWTLLADVPTIDGYTLSGFAIAAGRDGKIYLFGGAYYVDVSNAVFAYDPSTNTWSSVAPMPTARSDLAATTGADGRIYAIGGGNGLGVVEVYDPGANTWATATPMPHGRYGLAAATAPDGRIFALGGFAHPDDSAAVNWVEAYTPTTNTWTIASPLPFVLSFFSAAPGPFGRIYVFGGQYAAYSPATVYVYDPTQDVWGFAPDLPQQETTQAAAVAPDGRLITIGATITTSPASSTTLVEALTVTGTTTAGSPPCMTPAGSPLPPSGSWAPRAPLCETGAEAATLGPGRTGGALVYIVGGCGSWDGQSNCAHAYDPSTDTWATLPSMPRALTSFVAATGSDGRIYAFGSGYVQDHYETLSVAYDPRTRVWATVPAEPSAAAYYGAATGPNGLIYVLGGTTSATIPFAYDFAVFNSQTSGWAPLAPPLYRPLATWTMAVGGDGRVYAFPGGGQVEVYDPQANTWSFAPALHTFRDGAAATTGPDGRVYLLGGNEEIQGPLSSVEAYQPGATGWEEIAPMPHPAWYLAAATDEAGRIYAIGGVPGDTTAVQVYAPTSIGPPSPYPLGTWQPLAPLPIGRDGLAAATSPDGHVYALGGQTAGSQGHCVPRGTAEIYTPATNTWAELPPMPTARYDLAAVVAGDERTYAIGGWTDCVPGSTPLSTVEAYDPTTNQWSTMASLPVAASIVWAWPRPDGTINAITDYYPDGSAHALTYQPQTDTWTDLGSIATPPVDGDLTYGPDGRLYDVGGESGNYPNVYDVTTYDGAANQWDPGPSLLLAQSGPRAVTGIGPSGASEVFAIGGLIGNKVPQSAYAVEVLNPAVGSWAEAASVPYGGRGFAVTTLNGHALILGGSSPYASSGYSADVDEYVPPSSSTPTGTATAIVTFTPTPSPTPTVTPSPTTTATATPSGSSPGAPGVGAPFRIELPLIANGAAKS